MGRHGCARLVWHAKALVGRLVTADSENRGCKLHNAVQTSISPVTVSIPAFWLPVVSMQSLPDLQVIAML
jgi:hypothetical protein